MTQPITVLYATMSGNSMDCAHRVADRLAGAGHAASAVDLAGYAADTLLGEHVVLLCISTWGEGDPPDDAVEFVEYLRGLAPGDLRGLEFSVFALGDYNYEHFCKCGRDLDARLEELGGRRIAPRFDGDVDFALEFDAWSDAVVKALSPTSAKESY